MIMAEVLDLREVCKGKRTLVIGDAHGCFDEVAELQTLFRWNGLADVMVFTGDLIDRGPKIAHLVDLVKSAEDFYTVEGNHEDKFKRWMRQQVTPPKKGNSPVHVGHALQMTIDDMKKRFADPKRWAEMQQWFEGLPTMIRISDDIYVVHAGVSPAKPIEYQDKNDCIRIRNYAPPGYVPTEPWWNYWGEGQPTILFGHNVQPEAKISPAAYALDGGCVFGGELRGIEVIDGKLGEVKSVRAKRVYYNRDHIKQDE